MTEIKPFNIYDAIAPPKPKGKPADQGWGEYINKQLAPVMEGMGAGLTGAQRAFGPLKGSPLDTAANWAASQIRGVTPEENKARVEAREQANPKAAEAGYRLGGFGRDAYLAANPYTRAIMTADRLRTMGTGSALGTGSQALDEWDQAVNQNKPVVPHEVAERLTWAGAGGGTGAMLGAGGARKTPYARDMAPIPGGPLSAADLTAITKAEQLARQHGDTAPDLAMLMRLTEDSKLTKRAADVESMYRKATPVSIHESDIAQYGPPGKNRLEGRLTNPVKEGRADVVPEILDQLKARGAPGGFTQNVDALAADLAHRQRQLDRTLGQRQVGVRTPVTDVIPPPGAAPQSTVNARNRLYKQDVEAERAQPHGTFLTEAEAKRQVGSENQMRFWDATLARLPANERALLEDALGSIQPRAGVGGGPPGIGTAITKRTAAQRALDEHGKVQRAIGESYPYTPGQPPELTISPPAFTGARIGMRIPDLGKGMASRSTTKAFKDPTVAATDIGRRSPAEIWAAFLGSQAGATLAPMFWSNVREHEGRR